MGGLVSTVGRNSVEFTGFGGTGSGDLAAIN